MEKSTLLESMCMHFFSLSFLKLETDILISTEIYVCMHSSEELCALKLKK